MTGPRFRQRRIVLPIPLRVPLSFEGWMGKPSLLRHKQAGRWSWFTEAVAMDPLREAMAEREAEHRMERAARMVDAVPIAVAATPMELRALMAAVAADTPRAAPNHRAAEVVAGHPAVEAVNPEGLPAAAADARDKFFFWDIRPM
jgi:hypothetical protein